jgi:hypothetical protein
MVLTKWLKYIENLSKVKLLMAERFPSLILKVSILKILPVSAFVLKWQKYGTEQTLKTHS